MTIYVPHIWWDTEYTSEVFPSNPLVADNILDKGEKAMLAGPSESGKSYLAMQWGMELASAGDWFGWSVLEQCSVLLAQAEVSDPRYQERYKKMRANYPAGSLPIAVVTTEEIKIDTEGGRDSLCKLIELTKPTVLVLDPLRAFLAGDENSSEHAEAWFTGIAHAQSISPFTLLVVHHVTKPAPGYASDEMSKWSIRGSGLWTDRPSTIAGLTCNGTQTKWMLNFLKTRNRERHPDPLALNVDHKTGLFVMHEDLDPTTIYVRRIVDAVRHGPRKQADVIKELADAENTDRGIIYKWVAMAVSRGIVSQRPAGGRGGGYILEYTPIDSVKLDNDSK